LGEHNIYMLSCYLNQYWGQSTFVVLLSKSKYIQDNDVVIFNEAFYPVSGNRRFNHRTSSNPTQTVVLGRTSAEWARA
ncbi:sphingomyelin phosphodiesterase, partial [Staphylococcus pseudintermedius]